jgi:hypothetical protein
LILAPDGWPKRANDCPIVLYPDAGGEPFGLDRWQAWQALDSDSDLHIGERELELERIARSMWRVANEIRSLSDLRHMAAEGHLRGFVHRDARDLLALDSGKPTAE